MGGALTLVGFAAYFFGLRHAESGRFFFTAFPYFWGGLALKAAELEPVPYTQTTSPEVLKLREEQATATQNQVRQDVTRYRYGQEAHLDIALEKTRPQSSE